MSKKTSKEELEKLVQIIARHPNGVSIEELLNFLAGATPKRTLQYRLSNLVNAGILKSEGSGRSSKYHIREVLENKETSKTIDVPSRSSIIPLSPEAQEVQKLISAPIQLRRHVSYQREFLDSYEPYKTFFKSVLKKCFIWTDLPYSELVQKTVCLSMNSMQSVPAVQSYFVNFLIFRSSWKPTSK